MKKFDVITVGTATRDVFLTSPLFKVVKDEEHLKKLGFSEGKAECFAFGGKIEVDNPVFTTGGGATNTAVTFARNGMKTACVCSLAKDKAGEDVVDDLKKEGVKPLVSYVGEGDSGYSTLLLTGSGERTVLVARGAASMLNPRSVALSSLRGDWVFINPGTIEFSVIKKVVDHFYDKGSFIAMNPSSYYLKMGEKKLAPILKKLAVVTLNRNEGALLTKAKLSNERAIFKKFSGLLRGLAVMTDGAKGVLLSNGSTIFRAGIFKEKRLVDRTGAGDAFASGFVAYLARNNRDYIMEKGIKKLAMYIRVSKKDFAALKEDESDN